MQAYKVYISSTQQDLVQERLVLKETLEQAGYDPRCMEKYPAFADRPRVKCEQDVAASNLYVCIIGSRYGSQPVENGIQLEKSFTEYEYDSAMAKRIPVFAFIKRLDRSNDSPELQNFTKRLMSSHGIKEFGDPDELVAQVLIALTSVTGQAVKKGLVPDLKYYCNRQQQAFRFESLYFGEKLNRPILFFLLTGHELNYHVSFINRYKCELKARSDQTEPVDINFNMRISAPDTDLRIVQTIKEEINTRVSKQFGIGRLPDVTAAALFDLLSKARRQILFICINIQSSYLRASYAELYKASVEKFFADFDTTDSNVRDGKKILIFLNLKYLDNTQNEDMLRIMFEEDPFFDDKKLPRLEKINDDDMYEWLESNGIEDNPRVIRQLLTTHFATYKTDGADDYFMADAEIEMEKIIENYNSKTT
jgi:hypothetical protein